MYYLVWLVLINYFAIRLEILQTINLQRRIQHAAKDVKWRFFTKMNYKF